MAEHICNWCGGDADVGGSTSAAIYYGADGEEKRWYCDRYCAEAGEGERDGKDIDGDSTLGLVLTARRIKARLAERGFDWRKV